MTETPLTGGRRYAPPWPKDALRGAFGLIWAIDAGLKWAPGSAPAICPQSWASATASPAG